MNRMVGMEIEEVPRVERQLEEIECPTQSKDYEIVVQVMGEGNTVPVIGIVTGVMDVLCMMGAATRQSMMAALIGQILNLA